MDGIIDIDKDWKFHLGDEPDAGFMGYDDSAWRELTLPHDWSVEQPFDRKNASGTGYLPGGTAWYRKHFIMPEGIRGKRVRVTFGGVYKHARVWINSNYLSERAYGYSTFTFDISEFVRSGENVLSVRVEHNEVADSRWFTGSGIYRDVYLDVSDMRAFATDGVFITTERADADEAVIKVAYEALGGDGARFEVTDGAENVLARAQAAGMKGAAVLTVKAPHLWNTDSPYMYNMRASVIADGAAVCTREMRFGIRTLRFDADEGFFINGVNTKLKGVCVHHDGGALGAAVPWRVWERRLAKLKKMGCNAIRTSHNPPDSLLLDLCDQMGFMVMDEAFDEWEGTKNKWWQGHNVYPPKHFGYAEDFHTWHRADLEGMVKRDRNHPCVILWSIGNEIDYPNDPYVTPLFDAVLGNNDANKPAAERRYDSRKPDASRLAVVARELTEIVKSCDTTRPVTSALAFPELSNRTGYAAALDAAGYNYEEALYEEDHKKYPERVIYGSENGHSVEAWRAVIDHDYICGQFLWTGIDYLGECAGWPVRISQAGLLTLAGYEKPIYYQRRAMWSDEPFVRIAVGHGGAPRDERFAWEGEPDEKLTVSVYTNCAQAELSLNGRSLGVHKAGLENGCRACWEVAYESGELRASANGVQDVLATAGNTCRIELCADRKTLRADGQDIAQVEVRLCDERGNTVVNRDERIIYRLTGDARILGIENGAPDDLTSYSADYRVTCDGRAIVYLRAGELGGGATLYAYTRSGLEARLEFE